MGQNRPLPSQKPTGYTRATVMVHVARRLSLACCCALPAGSAGCSDATSSSADQLGPVLPGTSGQSGDAGPALSDAAQSADRAPAADAPEPAELRTEQCPEMELPTEHSPLDAVRSLALTDTRVIVASRSAVHVFDRAGGCADTSASAAPRTTLPIATEAVAPGPGDSFLSAEASGLVLRDANGAVAATCSDESARAVSTLSDHGIGLALLGTADLRRVDFTSDTCATIPLSVSGGVFALLAAASDPARLDTWFVAVQRAADLGPVVLRQPAAAPDEGPLPEVAGACSVAALLAAPLGVAALDPTCHMLHVFEPDAASVTATVPLSAGRTARAMATVPATDYDTVTIATVSTSDSAVHLEVVSLSPD